MAKTAKKTVELDYSVRYLTDDQGGPAVTEWIARPAARGDVAELIRLAWGYCETDKASEIDGALRQLIPRLLQ